MVMPGSLKKNTEYIVSKKQRTLLIKKIQRNQEKIFVI